jgi:hypothetical protein
MVESGGQSVPGFRPRLAAAVSPGERMGALCEFIEFWLGPRADEYGEPVRTLDAYALPMPLRRLYEFAGRWPGPGAPGQSARAVGAFSIQDALRQVGYLETAAGDRVRFLDENQGCWVCSTLTEGVDPPVWCEGDLWDDDGAPLQGGTRVCDSLSEFLATFVLQELTLGSRCCVSDVGLSEQFESAPADAACVWNRGAYVHGSDASFWLWNGVLVADLWGSRFLAANHEPALALLAERQGPVDRIVLTAGLPWRLEVTRDGAAKVTYSDWPIEAAAEAGAGTLDFGALVREFSKRISPHGHPDANPVLYLCRSRQPCAEGQHIPDWGIVTAVFEQALASADQRDAELARLYHTQWPWRPGPPP